jgi:wobble nucleotide-excising tRNase
MPGSRQEAHKRKQDVLRTELEKACWAEKYKLSNSIVNKAFDGFHRDKNKFVNKVLEVSDADSNTETTLAELEEKAKTVYDANLRQEQPIAPFDAQALIGYESYAILKKEIVGSTDSNISAMIAKLKNSDWVRAGKKYHDENNGSCPFCQQSTPQSLARELNIYFDQSFESDTQELAVLASSYQSMSAQLTAQIARAEEQIKNSTVSDTDELSRHLDSHRATFASSIQTNIGLIAGKQGTPSQPFELIPIGTVVAGISKIFQDFNDSVARQNLVLNNISSEKETLAAQVWSYVAESLRSGIEDFRAEEKDLKEKITSVDAEIAANHEKKDIESKTLQVLEKRITSIKPTKDAINNLLTSLRFQGFSLQAADDGKSYKLVRSNGSDVGETLSEGEQTFVSFLYFYNLLKGGLTESGTPGDLIVVFDDPVSSLDSNVMSIVVGLIRSLLPVKQKMTGRIKQVFILTHNVYFHKEVAFNANRKDKIKSYETFWIVRKKNQLSTIDIQKKNPIKSSYDLLWGEIRARAEGAGQSSHMIQNVLRRILENYFKVLVGIDDEDICAAFDDQNKVVCRSLFIWINDGSHSIHEDFHMSHDDCEVESYLNVFQQIFEKTGHLTHYTKMMTRNVDDDNAETAAA